MRVEENWIPIDEEMPPLDTYILVSFENYPLISIGEYTKYGDGFRFVSAMTEQPYIDMNIFVNAWMPLPHCYGQ